MQESSTRKLIDIKAPVFRALTFRARKKGVSLKRYIEDLLEESAGSGEPASVYGVTDHRILSLIGIAKSGSAVGPDDDEKLNYILSK